jgi:SAM-dependent methyltransferase
MTWYETLQLAVDPLQLPLRAEVRNRLRGLTRAQPGLRLLDVGGRKSPYTIGVPASVTVTDLPRDSAVQHQLHLGLTDELRRDLHRRRSNITDVILDDMTQTALPAESFDAIVAVEVLEHVDDDDRFLANASTVLRPGGWFLMTTPNGDHRPIPSGDHRRHYRRDDLSALLNRHFDEVTVDYAICASRWRTRGLASWSIRHPGATAAGMLGNLVNRRESRRPGISRQAKGTQHLVALSYRKG